MAMNIRPPVRHGQRGVHHLLKHLQLWKPKRRQQLYSAATFHCMELLHTASRARGIDALLADLPAVHGQWPEPIETGPVARDSVCVLFAVCDPVFFHRNGIALVASAGRLNHVQAIHLHVYDAGPAEFKALRKLQQCFPHLQLTWTWETSMVRDSQHPRRIIYFQSMRFVRLFELVRRCRRPVLAVDVDSVVRRPLSEVDSPPEADVGMYLRLDSPYACNFVLASAIYIAASDAGIDFAARSAIRIAAHLRAGAAIEKLDQRCLWTELRRAPNTLNLWTIPTSLTDWDFAESSVIWHGKGGRKAIDIFRAAQRAVQPDFSDDEPVFP